jgi:hypothetical protein
MLSTKGTGREQIKAITPKNRTYNAEYLDSGPPIQLNKHPPTSIPRVGEVTQVIIKEIVTSFCSLFSTFSR